MFSKFTSELSTRKTFDDASEVPVTQYPIISYKLFVKKKKVHLLL